MAKAEYAIAYQLDRLQGLVERFGTVPPDVCNDPSNLPAMAFVAQALEIMTRGTTKQARAFVKRVMQGIDADGLLSLHEQDNDPAQEPTALRRGLSRFLSVDAPDHVVGVVFTSRTGLLPTVNDGTDSGGTTNYFLKEESRQWHPSFRGAIRAD